MDDKGGKSSNDANGSSFIQTSSKETTMKVTGNAKWDAMYHHLISYKKKHNDCLVPNRYKLMPQLGSWVSTQRRHYKQKQIGKDTPLTQERLDLLSKIGFVWATKDPRHVSVQLFALSSSFIEILFTDSFSFHFTIGALGTKIQRIISLQE